MPNDEERVQTIKSLYATQRLAAEKLGTSVPIERVFEADLLLRLTELRDSIENLPIRLSRAGVGRPRK